MFNIHLILLFLLFFSVASLDRNHLQIVKSKNIIMYIVLIRISISTKRHIKTHSHSCRNRKFYLHLSHGVNLHTDQLID